MSTSRENWGKVMAGAHSAKEAKPTLDQEFTLAQAYGIQSAMVSELGGSIAGFKGALSAKPAQQMFGVDGPLVGVLMEEAEVNSGFSLSEMVMPMLEAEMGFIVSQNISAPIDIETMNPLELTNLFHECCIAIELAEVAYTARPSAQDLVAGNSAAGRYLKGPVLNVEQVDDIQIEVYQDSKMINEGVSGEIGQQRALAAQLVNTAMAAGYPIHQGAFVMTGSIGKIIPAVPGRFLAKLTQASSGASHSFEWMLEA